LVEVLKFYTADIFLSKALYTKNTIRYE